MGLGVPFNIARYALLTKSGRELPLYNEDIDNGALVPNRPDLRFSRLPRASIESWALASSGYCHVLGVP
jgi:hypothetical protein